MNKKIISIIDYGMGNAQSVKNALHQLNVNSIIINSPNSLDKTNAIILPGVGSFKQAMDNLNQIGFYKKIDNLVQNESIPFLGICLGMQLIAKDSTENELTKGFGWIDARVRKINVSKQYRLPHVGWNQIEKKNNTILLSRVENLTNYYFDHTYALFCDKPNIVSSLVTYGNKTMVSSVEDGHIFGTQFHPEKSQVNGLRVLKAFTKVLYSD